MLGFLPTVQQKITHHPCLCACSSYEVRPILTLSSWNAKCFKKCNMQCLLCENNNLGNKTLKTSTATKLWYTFPFYFSFHASSSAADFFLCNNRVLWMQHHPGFKKMEIIASERGDQLHNILADFDTCSNLKQSPICPSNWSGIQKGCFGIHLSFSKALRCTHPTHAISIYSQGWWWENLCLYWDCYHSFYLSSAAPFPCPQSGCSIKKQGLRNRRDYYHFGMQQNS